MSPVFRLLPVLRFVILRRLIPFAVILIAAIATFGLMGRSTVQGAEPQRPFAVFVDDYFNAVFEAHPSMATGEGFHQYDDRLEDGSAAAVAKRV